MFFSDSLSIYLSCSFYVRNRWSGGRRLRHSKENQQLLLSSIRIAQCAVGSLFGKRQAQNSLKIVLS